MVGNRGGYRHQCGRVRMRLLAREHAALSAAAQAVFHGFRGLRASELENKQHRPRHVSFIVGWTCLTGRAKDDRYVGHDPRLLYAAVEGLRPVEIEEEYHQAVADTEAENERLRAQIAELTARLESMEGQNATLASMAAKLEQLLGRFSAT